MRFSMKKWARAACFAVSALAASGAGAIDMDVLSDSADAVDLEALSDTKPDTSAPMTVQDRTPSILLGFVGGGMFNTGRFLGSSERVSVPLPLVYFNYNDRVYWGLANVGGWLWRTDDRSFKFGLVAKGRGAVKGEYTGYNGIKDRNASVDAGLNMVWNTAPVTVTASVLTDAGRRSKGQVANLRFAFSPFRLSERWTLRPSLSAEWLSSKTVDYYYGVRPDETWGGAPLYTGRSTVNVNAALIGTARLSKNILLLAGAAYTRFGSGLTDSPLTSRKYNTLVFVGVGWVFLHLDR